MNSRAVLNIEQGNYEEKEPSQYIYIALGRDKKIKNHDMRNNSAQPLGPLKAQMPTRAKRGRHCINQS